VLGVVLGLAYPVIALLGPQLASPRLVAASLLVLLAAAMVLRSGTLRAMLPIPLAIAASLGWTLLTDDPVGVYFAPVGVNLIASATFALTLRSDPMIARFARLSGAELDPPRLAHCRQATVFWALALLVNAVVLAVLAVSTPTGWAWYAGVGNYVLLGLTGGSEFLIRRWRFREFGDNPLDRMLGRLLGE